jgi:hypothetical protein
MLGPVMASGMLLASILANGNLPFNQAASGVRSKREVHLNDTGWIVDREGPFGRVI